MEPFTIFEIAPLGFAICLVGGTFLAIFAPKLIPERQSLSFMLGDRPKMKYFTEVAIPEESGLIGESVLETDTFKREGVRVIDVLRGDASLRRDLASVELMAGEHEKADQGNRPQKADSHQKLQQSHQLAGPAAPWPDEFGRLFIGWFFTRILPLLTESGRLAGARLPGMRLLGR